ncbi:MAG: chromate efflux transporter [Vulcanimicrobiaceae bacterium]
MAPVLEVLLVFSRLGLSSFGGPIAHLGYFRDEFVTRRRWLSEASYAQTVALCQFLPGPASSQVGIILGYRRAGALGALAAWCGFTLPSAVALVAFAYGLRLVPGAAGSSYVHGLLVAAVAVVALAVANMAKTLAPDPLRRTLAFAVAIGALLAPANGFAQLVLIATGALFGWRFLRAPGEPSAAETEPDGVRGDPRAGIACALAFAVLVIGLPFAEHVVRYGPFVAFAKFFEVGALVFGGGHVVLPLLQAQVVPPGWISNASFIAGYGAAQAVPGPLFTFAAYLGAAMDHGPVHGVGGALLTLIAIFLPSFLLVAAIVPFWERMRRNAAAGAVLRGVNAAVVGVLLAALYSPVWVNAIRSTLDVALALAAFLALGTWRAPPWSVVLGSALLCGLLER